MSTVSVGQTLSPVTTAGGLYPVLDQQIIQLTMPYYKARQLMVTKSIAGQPGNTYVFARQTGLRTAVFSEIAPGAFVPMDSTPYGYSGVTVYKIAEGFIITRELIEDTYLPVVQDHMTRFANRAMNKIDLDCWKAIIAGASTSTAATGNSLGATGTTFGAYRNGAIGQQDVVQRETDITKINYFPDIMGVNPIQEQDLAMLPMFAQAFSYGEPIAVKTGFLENEPNLPTYGLQHVMTNNVPAGTAVVLASAARNPQAQYGPGMFFVEKRPMTTATEDVPARDAQAVYFTSRYAPSIQIGGVISLVTGLATT